MTAFILARDGYRCRMGPPGSPCPTRANTADHVVPIAEGGAVWDPANLRAACAAHNLGAGGDLGNARKRARRPGSAIVTVVMGPPAAGKSTYVRDHAHAGDIVIDLDVIAAAIGVDVGEHTYPVHVRRVAMAARSAAIKSAAELDDATVWIVHTSPDPDTLARYRARGYRLVVVDPGEPVVAARLGARPAGARRAAREWYAARTRGDREAADTRTYPPPSREW